MKDNSLKVQAYNSIKGKIIDCSYPPGTMLKEEQLKEEFNISRTPIRDALGRLEQEGLITIKSKKGILVSPIDFDEVNTIFEIRLLFEPYALLNYGYMLKDNDLLSCYNRHAQGKGIADKNYCFSLDDEFHEMIMSTITNHYISQSYSIISVQNKRLRILTGACSANRLEKTNQEHIKI